MEELLEGSFEGPSQAEYFNSFFNERETLGLISPERLGRVKFISYVILFGRRLGNCVQTCAYFSNHCSERSSDLCRISAPESDWMDNLLGNNGKYKETNWHVVWRRLDKSIVHFEQDLWNILGKRRVELFKEFLTHNALVHYKRYTKREVAEMCLEEPELFEAPYVSFFETDDDPFRAYIRNKIKGGETCLKFSDSVFSV